MNFALCVLKEYFLEDFLFAQKAAKKLYKFVHIHENQKMSKKSGTNDPSNGY